MIEKYTNNKSLLESIVNFSDDAIISKTLEGIITSWNKGSEVLFGYSSDEIVGKHISVIIPSYRIKEEMEIIEKIKKGKHVKHYETEHLRKDGRIINVSLAISPLKDENGVITGVLKIARESEKKYYHLFKNYPIPTWVIDEATFQFLDVNKAAISHYGYSYEEFLSMTAIDIRPDDEKERFLGLDRKNNHFGNRGLWRHKKKDGTIIYVEISLDNITFDGKKCSLIVAQDITEQKQAQEQRLQTQERYQQVMENILDGLMIDDPKGKVIYANDQFLKLFGLEKPDLENLVLEDYIAPEFREMLRDRHNRRVAGEDVPTTFEYQGLRKDGTRIWLEVRVCKVLENGKVLGTQSAIRDITDRKKIENDIIKLNQSLEIKVYERTAQLEAVNKELESFSYSVAHDLRAPLRIINGYSEILRADYSNKFDEEADRIIKVIVTNTKRMGKLIDEILNLARLGRKELTKHNTDMNALIKVVISEQMEVINKPVKFNIGTLLPVVCDSTLIRQVLSNLISNAIKYSGTRADQSVDVNSTQKDNHIIYSVKDNGVGFDMQYSDKLFGVFQRLHKQTEFEGTGVGLALVQKIITKHGGMVWADAEVDKGATFYFSLPIIDYIN